MSDIEQKRDFLLSLYSGKKWRARVKKMKDEQVIAIYLREQNRSDKQPKKDNKESGEDELPF